MVTNPKLVKRISESIYVHDVEPKLIRKPSLCTKSSRPCYTQEALSSNTSELCVLVHQEENAQLLHHIQPKNNSRSCPGYSSWRTEDAGSEMVWKHHLVLDVSEVSHQARSLSPMKRWLVRRVYDPLGFICDLTEILVSRIM